MQPSRGHHSVRYVALTSTLVRNCFFHFLHPQGVFDSLLRLALTSLAAEHITPIRPEKVLRLQRQSLFYCTTVVCREGLGSCGQSGADIPTN